MAHDGRLSFVALYEGKPGSGADEYAAEAQDRFRELERRKLIANIRKSKERAKKSETQCGFTFEQCHSM